MDQFARMFWIEFGKLDRLRDSYPFITHIFLLSLVFYSSFESQAHNLILILVAFFRKQVNFNVICSSSWLINHTNLSASIH